MWFLCIQYYKYIDLKTDYMKCCLNQLFHNHKQHYIWYPCNQGYKYMFRLKPHIANYLNQWNHSCMLKVKMQLKQVIEGREYFYGYDI